MTTKTTGMPAETTARISRKTTKNDCISEAVFLADAAVFLRSFSRFVDGVPSSPSANPLKRSCGVKPNQYVRNATYKECHPSRRTPRFARCPGRPIARSCGSADNPISTRPVANTGGSFHSPASGQTPKGQGRRPVNCYGIRSRRYATTPSIEIRSCVIASRSRIVTALSSSESKSTVTQYGVPTSSWRR